MAATLPDTQTGQTGQSHHSQQGQGRFPAELIHAPLRRTATSGYFLITI
jgi:hypothetical protein